MLALARKNYQNMVILYVGDPFWGHGVHCFRDYTKFELMLMRRAKAYSSSGSVV